MAEGTEIPPAEKSASNPAHISSGVSTLLRGTNGFKKVQNESESAQALPRRQTMPEKRLVQAFLVGGDLLLLGLAARLAWKTGGPLEIGDLMLCLIALILGAAFSCLALWLE